MNNTELQRLIVTVLKQGHLTSSDQLLALCNSELAGQGSPAVAKQRFMRALLGLAREGIVERTADGAPPRYQMPAPSRYRVRQVLDSWHVDRLHPDIADHWHTIAMCNEAEARTIVVALNELDRKTRATSESRRAGNEWAECYRITSLKGRIWTRSMVRDAVMAHARSLLLPVTSASVACVLDDDAFMKQRRGEIPARVIEAVHTEARRAKG